MSQYPGGEGGQALTLQSYWNGELTNVGLGVLHTMVMEAYGGELQTPGETNNI